MRIEKGGDLVEHLNIFKGILNQPNKVDMKIDEDDTILLLTLLINSYNNFMKIILYENDTVTLE